MRMDKLTTKFQLALSDAQSLAVGREHQYIEPGHLLIALLDQQGGGTRGICTAVGINVNQLRTRLGGWLDRLPTVSNTAGDVHLSVDLLRLFNVTDKLAQERKDRYLSSELFLPCRYPR